MPCWPPIHGTATGAGFERMEWRGEYGLDGDTVPTRNSYGAHCLNTEQLGQGSTCPQAQAFVQWNDQACTLQTVLPLA